MEQFASGWKRHYYGKGDVTAYRLHRRDDVPQGRTPVFGASVLMLLYGDAFWPTYTTGDNTGLVATDSIKNFIQRETLNFDGFDLEEYCSFLATAFLRAYPQTEGVQVSATEQTFERIADSPAFVPGSGDQAIARVEINRGGIVEAVSGVRGFRLLRLGGSTFTGFVRDEYTTLPEQTDRPLQMWLDLEWSYAEPALAFNEGRVAGGVREIVREVFRSFESGSIQQVLHRIGTRVLADHPSIAEVHLEGQNRTWDTVKEHEQELGVYTDPRPPYGCLGLRLKR
jgi:urate oxidase/2-oxo-4-hydroxy-4-carboxy-5-ureidoimidazoline decarboxylase